MAAALHTRLGMIPLPTATVLADHVLEPLSRPWAALGAGLLGGGALYSGALGDGVRLGWRLLCLLLAL